MWYIWDSITLPFPTDHLFCGHYYQIYPEIICIYTKHLFDVWELCMDRNTTWLTLQMIDRRMGKLDWHN